MQHRSFISIWYNLETKFGGCYNKQRMKTGQRSEAEHPLAAVLWKVRRSGGGDADPELTTGQIIPLMMGWERT